MDKRSVEFLRDLVNVRGELLLLKRSQRRLDEHLETLLRTQAGLATLLHEQQRLLEELRVADANVLRPREFQALKKAA